MDDVGNFDPTSGEADVKARTCRSHSRLRAELMDRRLDEMEAVGFRFTEEEGADSHYEPAAKGIRGERIFD